MTANHVVFESAVTTASTSKLTALSAAFLAQQTAYGAASAAFKAGGTYAAFAAAMAAADKTYLAVLDTAEAVRQQSVTTAKETLRATGEFAG